MEKHTAGLPFRPKRFGQILLRDIAGWYRGWLIAAAAVAGAVIVLSALTMLGTSTIAGVRPSASSGFYTGFFFPLLFVGGFISTSLAFREARQNGAAGFYLTLPASHLEKFASKLLSTTLGYALGSLVFFTATAAVSELVNRLVFGAGHGMFNPFDLDVLEAAGTYMLAQSLFLLGSLWFRKLAFVKTVLAVCVVLIGLAILTGIAVRIILADSFVMNTVQAGAARISGPSLNWSSEFLAGRFGPGGPGHAGLMVFWTILKILSWILTPVFWVAGYFRLRETEA